MLVPGSFVPTGLEDVALHVPVHLVASEVDLLGGMQVMEWGGALPYEPVGGGRSGSVAGGGLQPLPPAPQGGLAQPFAERAHTM
jgi:hypothetical protein